MPHRPLKICSAPGCAVLVPAGRCAAHQRRRYEQQDERRGTSSERGYDVVWRRLRRLILAGEPLCRICKTRGRLVPATEVDHIVRISRGGERLDPENLQPLCKPCHSRKTREEQESE